MSRVPPPTGPEGTVWFGGHPARATLCLRVCGDGLDPNEVTRLLGRAPTRSQRKGQPVLSDSGEVKRIARTGSWLLDEPVRGVNQGFDLSPRVLGLLGRRGITFGVDVFCEPDEEQEAALRERLGVPESDV